MATQLLLYLIKARVPDEPVPVLLPIAGWDPIRHPRLQDWLAERLLADHPALRAAEIGPTVVQALIAEGQILAVLDGLDELPPPSRAHVLKALNRSLGGDNQLILTSRTTEYADAVTAAGDVLTSAAVLEAQPLSTADVADYLQRALPPTPGPVWSRVLTGLRSRSQSGDPASGATTASKAIADVTTTALGLWLLRTVYTAPGANLTELLDTDRFPTTAALHAHLLDQLIPALISSRPPSSNPAESFRPRRQRDPNDARRWLSYLARLLTHPRNPDRTPRTRDLAWWRIAQDSTTPTRFGVSAGLTSGIAAACTLWILVLTLSLTNDFPSGLWRTLWGGLVFALVIGVSLGGFIGSSSTGWIPEEPGFADLSLRNRGGLLIRTLGKNTMGGVAAGFGMGLFCGALVALSGWHSDHAANGLLSQIILGLMVGSILGVVAGLVLGFGVGLTKWLENPASAEQVSTPLSNWRSDRTLNLIRMITLTLAVGLLTWLLAKIVLKPEAAIGAVVGLVLASGLRLGKHHAWMAYVIAIRRLARRGDLPHDLMHFLDDAHRLGLLRAVGPIYQFRHAELQDHLATYPSQQRQGPSDP